MLGSYVDDAFGGTLHTNTAQNLINFISDMGTRHGAKVNATKTEGPAMSLVILGLLYDS